MDRVLYIGEQNISSWSMRGWLAVQHKGLSFQERLIALRDDKDRSQRRKVSPTGKVPVLHDGPVIIPDSLAIIEYLEDTYPAPAHPPLWPAERAQRAHARWLAAAMHSGFAAMRAGMSFNLCFLPEELRANPDALADAREMMALWRPALATGGPFLFGAWSAADIMFAPAVVRVHAFRVPTDSPAVSAYIEAVLAHPQVARWMSAARALKATATY